MMWYLVTNRNDIIQPDSIYQSNASADSRLKVLESG